MRRKSGNQAKLYFSGHSKNVPFNNVVIFYLDMGHLVVVEVAGSGEPLAADAALVRLFAAVDAAMGVQARGGGEALAANVADVRPLSGVDSNVAFQQTWSVEGLAAEVAGQHVLLPATNDADVGMRRCRRRCRCRCRRSRRSRK